MGGWMALRRFILGTAVLWAMVLGTSSGNAAVPLIADLSKHLVAITTGFSGVDVLLFGAIDQEGGDVVVVVRGPSTEKIVRRKERKFGFWIRDGYATFSDAPAFYRVAATRPLTEIAPDSLWQGHRIGLDHLLLPIRLKDKEASEEEYLEALHRLGEQKNLFAMKPGRVELMGNRLFRTTIRFPANVPVGVYSVEVYLIRNGQIISAQTTPLSISKIGIGADIYDFAHQNAALYGLLCILLAGVVGWLSAFVLKKT